MMKNLKTTVLNNLATVDSESLVNPVLEDARKWTMVKPYAIPGNFLIASALSLQGHIKSILDIVKKNKVLARKYLVPIKSYSILQLRFGVLACIYTLYMAGWKGNVNLPGFNGDGNQNQGVSNLTETHLVIMKQLLVSHLILVQKLLS